MLLKVLCAVLIIFINLTVPESITPKFKQDIISMSRIIQIAVQMLSQHVILKQNSINILTNYLKKYLNYLLDSECKVKHSITLH
jgi:hypothetical protein